MIVLDTTVLVYAVGAAHPLAERARRLVHAIGSGQVEATATVEVVQEFVHVRARRSAREEAAASGRRFAELLAPLVTVNERDLGSGLALFETVPRLGAFDAVLAAVAIAHGVDALVSADRAFASVPGLDVVDLGEADQLLS